MSRAWNFSAGPAAMPVEVLQQAAAEMTDWRGSGMGVMEMSHRGKEFIGIYEQAVADLRALLAIPSEFRILFMQGGGIAENAIVPLNLSRAGRVDVAVTGSWSQKSAAEAQRYCRVNVACDASAQDFRDVPNPAQWRLSADASYVHVCTNETIHGVEFHELPDLRALGSNAPLVIDFSSHVLSRPVDWSRVGLAFGGAQKNIGPAGVTLVVVREDLIGHALPICPSAFDYATVAKHDSMYNTPPTFGIYMAGLIFQWIQRQGGVAALQARNIAKAQLLYDFLAESAFFENRVSPAWRSRMNVPFFLKDESRNEAFLAGAKARGLLQLKGHKSVGGMRASIYNAMPLEGVRDRFTVQRHTAMPLEGVQALVDYLREFEKEQA